MKKFIVLDNIFDGMSQRIIKERLLDNSFPWYFIKDVTLDDNCEQERPAFAHYFVIRDHFDQPKVNSDFNDIVSEIKRCISTKLKLKNDMEVLQARSFLQLPLSEKEQTLDTAHVDIVDKEHFVFLYYVTDNDAETVIYDSTSLSENMTELTRVKPKQGRVVIFNGKYYHTAEQPKKNIRCVVNMDVSITKDMIENLQI